MVRRVARALRAAGAREVVAVGGDEAGLLAEGIDRYLPDAHPGEGPVGGLLVALDTAASIVVVVACDMPDLSAEAVRALVVALASDASLAVAVADPLCAAWRPALATPTVQHAFAAGERVMTVAVGLVRNRTVTVDPTALRNVNRPDDLAGA
jgi:molybdopterin-guanine dinucleotide biosynthesis protein A